MQDDFSFSNLTPHLVLNGIEALGFECDGRLFELNSFENRVFQVGLEDQSPIVAKFYRPLRWTTPQIFGGTGIYTAARRRRSTCYCADGHRWSVSF